MNKNRYKFILPITIYLISRIVCSIDVFAEDGAISMKMKMRPSISLTYDKEILKYNAKIQEDPNNPELYYHLGLTLSAAGNDVEAIQKLEIAKAMYLMRGEYATALKVDESLGSLKFREAIDEINSKLTSFSDKLRVLEESNKEISEKLDVIIKDHQKK